MQIYAYTQHFESYIKDKLFLFSHKYLSQLFLVPIRQLPVGSS